MKKKKKESINAKLIKATRPRFLAPTQVREDKRAKRIKKAERREEY